MAASPGIFPAPALERIVHHLLAGEDSQASLLTLIALAGVSQYTRSIVRRLHTQQCLTLDALHACNRKTLGRQLLPRESAFGQASPDIKLSVFLSAARLFDGYGEAVLSGPGVTDLVLLEVARKQQHSLLSVRVQVSPPLCP